MKLLRPILLLVLALTLREPMSVRACPSCQDAIASSSSAEEINLTTTGDNPNFPAAINQSIYLMLAVPYLALVVGGFLIYRGVKKNEEYRQRLQQIRPGVASMPGGES